MDCEWNRNKRHYDISMSKRTRKPLIMDGNHTSSVTPLTSDPIGDILDEENQKGTLSSPNDDVLDEKDQRSNLAAAIQEDKKLTDGNAKEMEKSVEAISKCRSSLGQHFTEEEKQLQLVRKQKQGGSEGAKLKGMVSRYAKVLSHLIKIKRDSHIGGRNKPVIRLTKQ